MTSQSIYQTCAHCGKNTSRETDRCWYCQSFVPEEPQGRLRVWHVGAGAALLLASIASAYPGKHRIRAEPSREQVDAAPGLRAISEVGFPARRQESLDTTGLGPEQRNDPGSLP